MPEEYALFRAPFAWVTSKLDARTSSLAQPFGQLMQIPPTQRPEEDICLPGLQLLEGFFNMKPQSMNDVETAFQGLPLPKWCLGIPSQKAFGGTNSRWPRTPPRCGVPLTLHCRALGCCNKRSIKSVHAGQKETPSQQNLNSTPTLESVDKCTGGCCFCTFMRISIREFVWLKGYAWVKVIYTRHCSSQPVRSPLRNVADGFY